MLLPALLACVSFALAAPAFSQIKEGRDYQEDAYVTPYWTRAPVIEALGRAELEIPPNTASFDVTFTETDKDAATAMTRAVQRAKVAFEAIKRTGGTKVIAETSVEVEPLYEQYKDEDGDLVDNERADKIRGYAAYASIEVEVNGDLDLAGKVRAAALAAGPEDSSSLDISTKVSAEAYRAAYEAAAADAAARAKASAAATGATLGQLLVIQEGNGPCLGRWSKAAIGIVGGTLTAETMLDELPQAMSRLQTVSVTSQKLKRGAPITDEQIAGLDLPTDARPQTITSSVCVVYAAGK